MTTTATITAGPGKGARVIVTGRTAPGYQHVEFPGGDGPHGKNFWVRNGLLADILTEEKPVEIAPEPGLQPQPAPAAPVSTLVLVEAPELVEARIELARLERALVANFLAPGGGRGKQGLQRTNAQLRRGAEYARQVQAAKIRVDVLLNSTARAAKPVTPERLRGAVAVKTELGWHRVVRVNAKSVTVATPYSWTDRIPVDRIVDVR